MLCQPCRNPMGASQASMLKKLFLNGVQKFPLVVKIYLPAIFFVLIICWIGRVNNVPTRELFADPNEVANQPAYIGFFSQLGNLLWCSTSTICLFTALMIRTASLNMQRCSLFLVCSGLLVGLLLLDDLFEVHEYAAIALSGARGIYDDTVRPARDFYEGLILLIYAIAFFMYALWFRVFFLKSNFTLLILAIACFILSFVMDMAHFNFVGNIVLEDGSKFLGILSVFVYFAQYCRETLDKRLIN